ncbi:Aste57867_24309 [Aphanomyces stellatus]|uniref:Aste57867_24309 protein n=1 Tax=Aphanomyces stellatus TaxID=120398 RepID=A0A485LRX8_9STRA|nr:hypothetical protein As57867_024234 [Aphanomyces stellatus]VFU00949.1 Aste57867_24309 [Aphanomyces stellatus]
MLQIVTGTSGYDTPEHWCAVGQSVLQANPPFQTCPQTTPFPTTSGFPTTTTPQPTPQTTPPQTTFPTPVATPESTTTTPQPTPENTTTTPQSTPQTTPPQTTFPTPVATPESTTTTPQPTQQITPEATPTAATSLIPTTTTPQSTPQSSPQQTPFPTPVATPEYTTTTPQPTPQITPEATPTAATSLIPTTTTPQSTPQSTPQPTTFPTPVATPESTTTTPQPTPQSSPQQTPFPTPVATPEYTTTTPQPTPQITTQSTPDPTPPTNTPDTTLGPIITPSSTSSSPTTNSPDPSSDMPPTPASSSPSLRSPNPPSSAKPVAPLDTSSSSPSISTSIDTSTNIFKSSSTTNFQLTPDKALDRNTETTASNTPKSSVDSQPTDVTNRLKLNDHLSSPIDNSNSQSDGTLDRDGTLDTSGHTLDTSGGSNDPVNHNHESINSGTSGTKTGNTFNGNNGNSGNYVSFASGFDASAASAQAIILVLGEDFPIAQAARVVLNGVVASTMATLMAFHVSAIDPSSATSSATGVGPPNLWELPTFMTFLQNMAVVAMASIDAPYQPFVLFTDMFSWLLFQVKGSEPTPPIIDGNNIGNVTTFVTFAESNATTTNATSIYDAFGIEQFALRLHIRKEDMFIRAWSAFFIATGGILALLLVCHSTSHVLMRFRCPFASDEGWLPMIADHLTTVGQKLQGFLIWVATQAMMPLTAVSVFETSQQSNSSRGFGHSAIGIVALSVLLILGGACVGTAAVLYRQTENSLSKSQVKVTFGVLYVNLKYHLRIFCGLSLLVQFATGVFMSNFIQPGSQMIWLMGIHGLYLVVLLIVRPFITKLHLIVAVLVEVVNIVIYGLSFAQAKASHDDLDTKKRLGWAIMGLVGVLILLFFARSLVKLFKKLMGGHNKLASNDSSRDTSYLHRASTFDSDGEIHEVGVLFSMRSSENNISFRSMSPPTTCSRIES